MLPAVCEVRENLGTIPKCYRARHDSSGVKSLWPTMDDCWYLPFSEFVQTHVVVTPTSILILHKNQVAYVAYKSLATQTKLKLYVLQSAIKTLKGQRLRIALYRNLSQSYGASLAIWDHTVLPDTRHKWTRPALAPASQDGTRFTYPGGMEGWVELRVSFVT